MRALEAGGGLPQTREPEDSDPHSDAKRGCRARACARIAVPRSWRDLRRPFLLLRSLLFDCHVLLCCIGGTLSY